MAEIEAPSKPPALAIISFVAAVGGIAAAVLSQPPDRAAPAGAVAIAVATVSMIWMERRWRAWTAGVLAAVVVAAGGWFWVDADPGSVPPAAAATIPATAEDVVPEPGSAMIVTPAQGEAAPPCDQIQVRIVGDTPPDGWGYAVAQRSTYDTRYYFEPANQATTVMDLSGSGNVWEATVSTELWDFRLWIVAIDVEWIAYLSTTTNIDSHTWWSSDEWPPPGAIPIHDVAIPLAGERPDRCPEEE